MARVNHFLKLVRRGYPDDKRYITDNDLLPKGHPRSNKGVKKMEDNLINHEVLLDKHIIRVEDTPDGILVLFGRSEVYEGMFEDPVGGKSDGKPFDGALSTAGGNYGGEKLTKGEIVDLDIQFPIAKAEERLVTGVVLEPNVVDAHSDFESEQTIKEAAHGFLHKYNRQSALGLGHRVFGSIGVDLVESYIAPQDMTLGGEGVKKGSWIMTVKIHDDSIWNMVKSGDITGFSIGGKARVRPAKAPAP